MVTATKGSDVLERVRRTDRDLDEMLRSIDRFGPRVHLMDVIRRGVESAYNTGYVNGFSAARNGAERPVELPVLE